MSRGRERLDEIAAKKLKRDYDDDNMMMMMLGLPTSGGGSCRLNTVTPCAACKLLRRRCGEECPLSPYFSPHEPLKFAAVHKIFGASNVSKLLTEVPERQRGDAANSLVYEANVRLRDPVYGCMGAISALQHQVQSLHAELNAVRSEILRYKYTQLEAANRNIFATESALVSVTDQLPQAPSTPPPPPPIQPSINVVVPSPSSTSSLYTPPSSTSSYITISNNNIPFFN